MALRDAMAVAAILIASGCRSAPATSQGGGSPDPSASSPPSASASSPPLPASSGAPGASASPGEYPVLVGGSAASGATHVTVSIRARRAADVESVRQLPNLKGCYKKSAHYGGASRAVRFVWHVTVSPTGAATATGQALDGFLVDTGDHRQGWEYPPDAATSDEAS